MIYDPYRPVDPVAWEALDADERIDAVARFHRRKRHRLPSLEAHALIHVLVENQIAQGNAFPAKAALARLLAEGLDRHEAIHALGSIAAEAMFKELNDRTPVDPVEYESKVERLTAASWRSGGPGHRS